ncbi:MaoC/PaaZ C-terminal domain-containing protein [Nocardia sp. CA-135953]|uniref:MaoC/PaaZ C-terminal domain-containing protein n=1 Tax=Nocardia sp. CA-135953 TaxID=3239978 RepID=UPI003D996D44
MSDHCPGQELPVRRFGPQTRTDIVRYQGASGDFNPVHHDDEFAKAGGMPGAFSVGMLQAGYLGTYCAELFGPESVRLFSVRFSEQVWPGDVLVCAGRVEKTSESDGERQLELALTLSREGGGVAVTAAVVVAVPGNG